MKALRNADFWLLQLLEETILISGLSRLFNQEGCYLHKQAIEVNLERVR